MHQIDYNILAAGDAQMIERSPNQPKCHSFLLMSAFLVLFLANFFDLFDLSIDLSMDCIFYLNLVS